MVVILNQQGTGRLQYQTADWVKMSHHNGDKALKTMLRRAEGKKADESEDTRLSLL